MMAAKRLTSAKKNTDMPRAPSIFSGLLSLVSTEEITTPGAAVLRVKVDSFLRKSGVITPARAATKPASIIRNREIS